MKLFFDQNVSYRILKKIDAFYSDCVHSSTVGLNGSPDIEIRSYCLENDYTIVTFDSDFYEMANLLGHPPKIIWLRMGNRTTSEIASLLIKYKDQVTSFIEDHNQRNEACLEINEL